jgi:hypothetical protein
MEYLFYREEDYRSLTLADKQHQYRMLPPECRTNPHMVVDVMLHPPSGCQDSIFQFYIATLNIIPFSLLLSVVLRNMRASHSADEFILDWLSNSPSGVHSKFH